MAKKKIPKDSKATEEVKIKVKRTRRRLYESVQDDEKRETSNKTEKESKKRTRNKRVKNQTLAAKTEDIKNEDDRLIQANKIVHHYIRWAMGVSLVPIPTLDIVTVMAVQLRMLKKLSDHYEMEFSRNRVKSLIASLIGGLHSGLLGGKLVASFIKLIPGIGLFVGTTAMSLFSGAVTYAVGKVFIQHFESGGTFLDFNPKKVKEHFVKQFEEGKKQAEKK